MLGAAYGSCPGRVIYGMFEGYEQPTAITFYFMCRLYFKPAKRLLEDKVLARPTINNALGFDTSQA